MSVLVYENNRFMYVDDKGDNILLDCNRYLDNLSRLPFHTNDDSMTIPRMILELSKDSDEYMLMDVLVCAHHIKSSEPKKVLQLGCGDGVMSYHIGSVLGRMHRESLLYCVSEGFDIRDDEWLKYVNSIEIKPQIAYSKVDMSNTHLMSDEFDVVVINGNEDFIHPELIINEAVRVLKNSGILICYISKFPLLEDAFKILINDYEEYWEKEKESRVLLCKKI